MIVEFVVAKGKKEQARCYARIDDGVLGEAAAGTAPDAADVVFTCTPADASALRDGALDLSAAFMRGQIKMAGDFGALLQLLPVLSGPTPAIPAASLLTLDA